MVGIVSNRQCYIVDFVDSIRDSVHSAVNTVAPSLKVITENTANIFRHPIDSIFSGKNW